MRHSRLALLPTGTTSNESLHHETNTWFRETQKLHKATLQLKLSIMHLGKLLSHNVALYRPATRQMAEAEVLARATARAIFTDAEWREWCGELADGDHTIKAGLELHKQRECQRSKVKPTLQKRPASKLSGRRTPHTVLCEDNLRRAGVLANLFLQGGSANQCQQLPHQLCIVIVCWGSIETTCFVCGWDSPLKLCVRQARNTNGF